MTVEAAAVIPIFLLTVSTLLGVLDIYRVQSAVKTSLHESALELGMYAYAAESGDSSPAGIVSSAVCAAYAKRHLPEFGDHVKISMAGSSYKDHQVKLTAHISYKIPLSILPLPAIRMVNESCVNSWTGQNISDREIASAGGAEEMVYVTEYESVYHTSSECTHLDLTIHLGSRNEVEGLRNEYGQKYKICEKCGSSNAAGGIVYYTQKGDRYHTSESCSGLKRTVRLVKKSEIQASCQCERCKAKGAA
ncbi:MAG: hypothetical protein EOM40_04275 [Clostridia bacterium]|nr:hypothetical protein [Clostridia bacterium]